MTTLRQVLQTLGPGLLSVLASPSGLDVEVQGVVIYDRGDPPPVSRGTIVLGVGAGADHELVEVMSRVAADGGVLVVKVGSAGAAALTADAERVGLTLVGLAQGAGWMHLASLLRSVMNDDAAARDDEELGGVAAGDLFSVANAVSALIDAPVTIEDPQARVLAYSSRQDEADEARMQTILGRQVPEQYYRRMQSEGLFRKLYREKGAMYIDSISAGVLPRIAVAVRAGDEVLGSIWAAVKKQPSADQIKDFAEASRFVAIHLLRHRLASDMQRGLQADLISVILSGGALAGDAASRLGLAGASFRVVAVGMRAGDAIENEVPLMRAWDILSLHLSVNQRRAVTGLVGGVVYAIVPTPPEREAARRVVRQVVQGYVARLPQPLRENMIVAIGGAADTIAEVPKSRQDADRVLIVLRGQDGKSLGEIEDLRMQVLMLRLSELAADDPVTLDGPLSALLDSDMNHGTRFVETLQAYLDAFGDIAAAANRLKVHHNTLRYRLNKLRQMPGLDLDDAEQRLAIQLQLRMLDAVKAG